MERQLVTTNDIGAENGGADAWPHETAAKLDDLRAILRGLEERMRRDGFATIADAVGSA